MWIVGKEMVNPMQKEVTHSNYFVIRQIPFSMEDESMKKILHKGEGQYTKNDCKSCSDRVEGGPTLYTPYHIGYHEGWHEGHMVPLAIGKELHPIRLKQTR